MRINQIVWARSIYRRFIISQARIILLVILIVSGLAAYFASGFRLDASAESLVLENDTSLQYYREIRERYGSDDFLIISYTTQDLFSRHALATIRRLRDQILSLPSIKRVVSILDAPIVFTTDLTLSTLPDPLPTLEDNIISKLQARQEFTINPLYRGQLVSEDGNTTALQIFFEEDQDYYELIEKKTRLQRLDEQDNLSEQQKQHLKELKHTIKDYNAQLIEARSQIIAEIRRIMKREGQRQNMFLGGIPMITVDMIKFIKYDLVNFGIGVLVFLVLILYLFFREPRWVLLPLCCCLVTAILIVGYLGLVDWRVTVISSNFLSILMIITLSLTVHLIVRYRDLQALNPIESHPQLITKTMESMFKPCSFTILTTIVGFGSLVVSNIKPVMDFGWIMILGLALALLVSFTLFPAMLAQLGASKKIKQGDFTRQLMHNTAIIVMKHPRMLVLFAVMLMIFTGLGIGKLYVENRFIDNFRQSTEIYQGMIVIDQKLGGTTPLEIIIDPDTRFHNIQRSNAEDDLDFSDLKFVEEETSNTTSYWLTPFMMEKLSEIHSHLESYPITGKVLSLATTMTVIEHLNREPLNELELALLQKRVPAQIRSELIDPYLSENANQTRITARVSESDPALNRKTLLNSIRNYLINEASLDSSQFRLTGMLVLYNNMLQSLYRSQILTIGAVFLAIFITFILLFRNISLASVAIVPNILPAVMILGFMGWAGIPLDMMTITIAAITIGISVDDTIHYIHRVREAYAQKGNYPDAIMMTHTGVGKAMFYTTIAIIFGFSLLTLSNFIPTIYFGILTGLGMLLALLSDLLFLPAIILLTRPDMS